MSFKFEKRFLGGPNWLLFDVEVLDSGGPIIVLGGVDSSPLFLPKPMPLRKLPFFS